MGIVSTRDAKNKFIEHGRRAEAGEYIVVTRYGKPGFDIMPNNKTSGINDEAGEAYLQSLGIEGP